MRPVILFMLFASTAANGDNASPPPAPTVALATAAGVDPSAPPVTDGLATPLAAAIHQAFDRDGAASANRQLDQWKKRTTEFEQAWTAYTAQANTCRDAIDKAASEPAADAAKTLLAVITPNALDADGKIAVDRRKFLETIDAEVPAIGALGKLDVANKDYLAAASLPVLMQGRRHVGAVDDERLLWLAYTYGKEMRDLAGRVKPPLKDVLNKLVDRGNHEWDSRRGSGRATLAAFPDLGPKFAEPWDAHDVKAGDWVFLHVHPTKIDDKKLNYSDHGTYDINVNCRPGNELDGWDPVLEKWMYKTVCDTRQVTENVELKATFAAPPPAWAKDGNAVWLLGKAVRVGPKHWEITSAGIADWRFLGLML
jgi:hypothetical protein